MNKIYTLARRFKIATSILLVGLIHISTATFAQVNRMLVKGTVITMDERPLSYASIQLKDSHFGTVVKQDGQFRLEVPAGQYILQVKYAGFIAYEKEINLIENQAYDLGRITVSVNSHVLREIIVADIERNKYAKKQTDGIARMPLANLQNPQAYTVVSKELMQELGAIDYNTAMSQTPGVLISNGVNDNGNGVLLRGFSFYSSMRNGLPSDSRSQSELFNLERVEVIKGPSATLFGAQATSYGGVVNNVTKKPFESFRGEVAYSTGSWGLNRLTADINTPLNAERTALLRVNAMGSTENSFQDAGGQRAFGIAASLLFKPNDRTSVRLDADFYQPEKTLVAFVRNTQQLSYGSMDKVPLPFRRSLLTDDIRTKRNTTNVAAELEYKIAEDWLSRTSYQQSVTADVGSIFFVPRYLDDEHIVRQYRIFDDFTINHNSLQQNILGNYKVGSLKNSLVAGVDLAFYKDANLSMHPYFLAYDTVGIRDKVWSPITRAAIQKSRDLNSPGNNRSSAGYTNLSAYASQVTNLADRLFLMLSLRVDRYTEGKSMSYIPATAEVIKGKLIEKPASFTEEDGYGQTFLSPKVGLVYQPLKKQVSIFANYMNSFTNKASSLGLKDDKDLTLQPILMRWKPEEANQFEVGLKLELLAGKISSSLSYYAIQVKNMLRAVVDNTVFVQDGKQRSAGADFELIANPLSGWNLMLGYGYNNNKYLKHNERYQGRRMNWSPKNIANAWTSYKLLSGAAKGFGLGAGLNYMDKSYFDLEEKFHVPAFTTVSATTFYDQAKYRLGLKFNNLSSKKYWDRFGKPQKPFEFLANLSFKF